MTQGDQLDSIIEGIFIPKKNDKDIFFLLSSVFGNLLRQILINNLSGHFRKKQEVSQHIKPRNDGCIWQSCVTFGHLYKLKK